VCLAQLRNYCNYKSFSSLRSSLTVTVEFSVVPKFTNQIKTKENKVAKEIGAKANTPDFFIFQQK